MTTHNGPSARRATRLGVLAGLILILLFAQSAGAQTGAPEVVTVPWRGALDLPHEVYNGKQVHLKGIARNLAPTATASWDPGDGSGVINVVPNPSSAEPTVDYDLGVTHTYPDSSPQTPYTATLTVCNNISGTDTECDSDTYRVVVRTRTLDVEVNIAIDEGLWYLHRQQTRNPASSDDGRFVWSNGYSRDGAVTASAVQAFQINNHFKDNSDAQDPYADTLRRGLRYMFSRLYEVSIGTQPAGDPDSNGNGLGVSAGNTLTPTPTGVSSRPIYETGQFMDAIVSSKTPNEPVPATSRLASLASPSNPGGPYTYFDAVQDMVDMYAWGQDDSGSDRGGWRYGWNSDSDNSACQWAAIGILPARDLFGATVPQFVIDENLDWLSASQTPAPPTDATGYGYTGRGEGFATTPSGLIQAIMNGVQKTDTERWVGVEQRMATLWNSWYRDTPDEYRLYALTKAMRLALPSPIIIMGTGANAVDWFGADCADPDACTGADQIGVARTLIRDQNDDGLFTGSFRVSGNFRSAWSIIMLTGVIQLQPVAVAKANPNPGADGVPVNFDGTDSFHKDPSKTIVTYEWDFNNDNVTDATGRTAANAFDCPTLPTPCDFPVRLTVTDDTTPTPLVDTDTIVVTISNPPRPPSADPNGPYLACVGEDVLLDGSASFDIDEPLGDSITAWDWELNPPPFNYDDASGETVPYAFASAGLMDIGLRVTDDSANVFGGPNLTNDAFTTALIQNCDCIDDLRARPKRTKIQLNWSPVAGAASYDIYRSETNATSGFSLVAGGHATDVALYLDQGLTTGQQYWYRVVPKDGAGDELCGTEAASATLTVRTRR